MSGRRSPVLVLVLLLLPRPTPKSRAHIGGGVAVIAR
jgi:hypothetical protein